MTREILGVAAFLTLLLAILSYSLFSWRVWSRHREIYQELGGEHWQKGDGIGPAGALLIKKGHKQLGDAFLDVVGLLARVSLLGFLALVLAYALAPWLGVR